MEYMLQYIFTQLFFTCFGQFNRQDYLLLFAFEKNKQNIIFPPKTSVFRQELTRKDQYAQIFIMPPKKARGNKQWEHARTGIGKGPMKRRRIGRELAKTREI